MPILFNDLHKFVSVEMVRTLELHLLKNMLNRPESVGAGGVRHQVRQPKTPVACHPLRQCNPLHQKLVMKVE